MLDLLKSFYLHYQQLIIQEELDFKSKTEARGQFLIFKNINKIIS